MSVVMNQNHPVFEHDCEACKYLGSITMDEMIYACYFCDKSIQTYVGRYGSHGDEYISLPSSFMPMMGNMEPYKTIIGLHNQA